MANYYDFVSFQNYTIGCGALRELGRITFGYGQRYLIMHDHHATDSLVDDIKNSLHRPRECSTIQADNLVGRSLGLTDNLPHPELDEIVIEYEFYPIPGKACSYQNAQTAGQIIAEYQPDVVVAVGGSKCLDLIRAALHYVGAYERPKLVLCPTIISSNASVTGMSIFYDADTHQMVDSWNLAIMPECVIVDTGIIIGTPVSTFVAGIGDQISSSIEALHTLRKIGVWDTCDPLCIAHHQAVLDVLQKYSDSAVEAMKRGVITKEFEWVCHALTRYTGPQLAVATSYLSHILDEALINLPAVAKRMHGEVVGFGVLPEMVAFGDTNEMYQWVDLFRRLGIPVTLEELGIPGCSYETLLRCCQSAANNIMAQFSIVQWEPEEVAKAVIEADQLVKNYLERS